MNFKSIKKDQLIFGIILGVAISIITFFSFSVFLTPRDSSDLIDMETYQAVFLDDKQIYFGKLKGIDSPYPILDDVYYVKLEDEKATSGRLVKLGLIEPHGPRDQMIINREHILFWENLKPDSSIVQTIRNLKLNQ